MAVIIAMSSMQLAVAAHRPLHCTKWQNNCQKYDHHCTTKPKSCCDILKSYQSSGDFFQEQTNYTRANDVYVLKRSTYSTSLAYCDMTTAEGGWMVIMRRADGVERFNRYYDEYEEGFGDLNHDFFYGLKALHDLTHQTNWSLRIDFYDQSNDTESSAYVTYDNFTVGRKDEGYKLKLGTFESSESTFKDNLKDSNEQKFVAHRPNELPSEAHPCLQDDNIGGWWYSTPSCSGGPVLTDSYNKLRWRVKDDNHDRGEIYHGKYELKIRQNNCLSSINLSS